MEWSGEGSLKGRPRNFISKLMESEKNQGQFSHHKERTVDFVIGGTQKGGTSALDAYLRRHPKICMANQKEVHFFDDNFFFQRSTVDYNGYHSNFSPEASHELVGEATPIYMYWQDAPRRIWEYNPRMKWIILLRNPIDRAYSHWNMERSRNSDNMSFWNAIRYEQERCREALPRQHRVYSYIDRGYYLSQLRKIWQFFPNRQVLILKNEYLKSKSTKALRDICDFLEIEHFRTVADRDVHSRPYDSCMSDEEKKYLRFLFEHEIKGLERTLGWDCNDWLFDR